ncbi:DoxX family protein [Roseimaritima sediminicola]|uniref:DoxX family protein n=1 Tax=Roseimaritima sediminicola TaxID=2662066 RepID=UPI0012982C71|nr:DoxX family protein [Roseimaritima sediminicola]
MLRDTLNSTGLLVLRVLFGLLMLVHGWQKLSGFGELAEVFPDPIGIGSRLSLILAIGAEFGCSLLLIIGLATRLATIPLAFTMLVAGLVVHSDDPWQKKELAFCYLTVYIVLLLTGPGKFSLDHLLANRKSKTPAE